MNLLAAAKAVGVWLAIVGGIAVWFGGTLWATVTGQPERIQYLFGLIPMELIALYFLYMVAFHIPITSMYDHFNQKGGK